MRGPAESRAASWDPEPALRRHLEALVGERSPAGGGEGLRRAEGYARRILEEARLATSLDPIGPAQGTWNNVIGDFPATSEGRVIGDLASVPAAGGVEAPRAASRDPGAQPPLFVVGAHIDAVEGSPGADDNASGAAAMLALAEHFGSGPPGARRVTLRFAAFNLEEWGMLGSQHHADRLHSSGRPVEGMISLEMLGYVDPAAPQRYPPGLGIGRRRKADFISVVGNGASKRLVSAVAGAFSDVGGLPVETVTLPGAIALLIGAALSDHASFWRHGIPAVMVGDTSFYRNPHYHQPTDRLDTLSLPFLGKVTRGLAIFLERVIVARE